MRRATPSPERDVGPVMVRFFEFERGLASRIFTSRHSSLRAAEPFNEFLTEESRSEPKSRNVDPGVHLLCTTQ